jgi:hypothetical protein
MQVLNSPNKNITPFAFDRLARGKSGRSFLWTLSKTPIITYVPARIRKQQESFRF